MWRLLGRKFPTTETKVTVNVTQQDLAPFVDSSIYRQGYWVLLGSIQGLWRMRCSIEFHGIIRRHQAFFTTKPEAALLGYKRIKLANLM